MILSTMAPISGVRMPWSSWRIQSSFLRSCQKRHGPASKSQRANSLKILKFIFETFQTCNNKENILEILRYPSYSFNSNELKARHPVPDYSQGKTQQCVF